MPPDGRAGGAERAERAERGTDGRTDERTDGRADGRTDGRADGRTGGRTGARTRGHYPLARGYKELNKMRVSQTNLTDQQSGEFTAAKDVPSFGIMTPSSHPAMRNVNHCLQVLEGRLRFRAEASLDQNLLSVRTFFRWFGLDDCSGKYCRALMSSG